MKNPDYWALADKTILGLRRAGFPEE